jgi:hypothetical protein
MPNQTQIGRTALIRAALHGKADCVRLLLEGRADKNAKDNVCDLLRKISCFFACGCYLRFMFHECVHEYICAIFLLLNVVILCILFQVHVWM